MRFLGTAGRMAMLSLAAASAVALSFAPTQAAAMDIPRHANKRKAKSRRRARSSATFPNLNRSRRHPPAQSYGHAADISFALGFRTSGVR